MSDVRVPEAQFIATVLLPGDPPRQPASYVDVPAYNAADLPAQSVNGDMAVRVEDNAVLTYDRRFGWTESGIVWEPPT